MYNDAQYDGRNAAAVRERAVALVAPWGVRPHNAQQSRSASPSPLGCTEFRGWAVSCPVPGRPEAFVLLDLEAPLPDLAIVQAAAVAASGATPLNPEWGGAAPRELFFPAICKYEGSSFTCTPTQSL